MVVVIEGGCQWGLAGTSVGLGFLSWLLKATCDANWQNRVRKCGSSSFCNSSRVIPLLLRRTKGLASGFTRGLVSGLCDRRKRDRM